MCSNRNKQRPYKHTTFIYYNPSSSSVFIILPMKTNTSKHAVIKKYAFIIDAENAPMINPTIVADAAITNKVMPK